MAAVALSFDEEASARQPFRRSPRCAAVPPPVANDNHRTRCTVTRLFKAPRAPRFGVWGPAGELLAETDETGVVKREYVYLGNLPVAQVDGATGEVFYIHADHLGTPQAVTDALGQLAWEDAYQPFGTATNTGAATAVSMDLRFPGQRVSAETGYHYNYFRDYDPTLGRYLQSDPIGLAGGLNTYGYVGGNPISRIDPLGLWSTKAHNEMVDFAFGGILSEKERQILKDASLYVDETYQAPEESYRHWMRTENQDGVQGALASLDYLEEMKALAEECLEQGDREQALFLLGQALHMIMDSYSPVHNDQNGDPRKWYGMFNPKSWVQGHSPFNNMGSETSEDLTPEILRNAGNEMLENFSEVF